MRFAFVCSFLLNANWRLQTLLLDFSELYRVEKIDLAIYIIDGIRNNFVATFMVNNNYFAGHGVNSCLDHVLLQLMNVTGSHPIVNRQPLNSEKSHDQLFVFGIVAGSSCLFVAKLQEKLQAQLKLKGDFAKIYIFSFFPIITFLPYNVLTVIQKQG